MSIDEQTIKHLEIIQPVVSRLAQNSFAIKSIGVTLVVAVLAFIGSSRGNSTNLLIALVTKFQPQAVLVEQIQRGLAFELFQLGAHAPCFIDNGK